MAGRPKRGASLRARAIAEWRGYAEGRPVLDRMQSLSALVGKTMQAFGLGELVRESEVLEAWKETVGDYLALHTSPSRLKDGVLYVRVLQPSIHFEIERMKGMIVEKLKKRFGARVVRELRFRLG